MGNLREKYDKHTSPRGRKTCHKLWKGTQSPNSFDSKGRQNIIQPNFFEKEKYIKTYVSNKKKSHKNDNISVNLQGTLNWAWMLQKCYILLANVLVRNFLCSTHSWNAKPLNTEISSSAHTWLSFSAFQLFQLFLAWLLYIVFKGFTNIYSQKRNFFFFKCSNRKYFTFFFG